MRQKQFSAEQIVAGLKQAEARVPLAELIRRDNTFMGHSMGRLAPNVLTPIGSLR